jgi:hypothetical protein
VKGNVKPVGIVGAPCVLLRGEVCLNFFICRITNTENRVIYEFVNDLGLVEFLASNSFLFLVLMLKIL